MRQLALSSCLAMAVMTGLQAASPARAEDRKAEAILKEIDAVKSPALDRTKINDPTYRQEYIKQAKEAESRRAELIGELYKADPENAKLVTLLPHRWSSLSMSAGEKAVTDEVKKVIATAKNAEIKTEAAFFMAMMPIRDNKASTEARLKAMDEFIAAVPGDKDRAGKLLSYIASRSKAAGEKKGLELEDRLVKEYPHCSAAKMIMGAKRRVDEIGKPFELDFTDAIKGTEVSMKSLKGKVVVIDFWATWCGPCVAEMPKMKSLYAEFKNKGVEFIGVSLDQKKEAGGLDSLKEFVSKNEIGWPQYYQGNYWDSDFSSAWGVNSIPCVFLVDADGKLATVDARGKLETLIPEYLKKAKSSKADAGGGGN
jgi:thiol-disulfide isomerase/thioredoxin